jgi:hypothetical protein
MLRNPSHAPTKSNTSSQTFRILQDELRRSRRAFGGQVLQKIRQGRTHKFPARQCSSTQLDPTQIQNLLQIGPRVGGTTAGAAPKPCTENNKRTRGHPTENLCLSFRFEALRLYSAPEGSLAVFVVRREMALELVCGADFSCKLTRPSTGGPR